MVVEFGGIGPLGTTHSGAPPCVCPPPMKPEFVLKTGDATPSDGVVNLPGIVQCFPVTREFHSINLLVGKTLVYPLTELSDLRFSLIIFGLWHSVILVRWLQEAWQKPGPEMRWLFV